MSCDAMRHTIQAYLVFLLPLVALLLCALHLAFKMLCLDVDLPQSVNGISDGSRDR